jgi:hypothetical protein
MKASRYARCEQRDNARFKDQLESAAWKKAEKVLSCSDPTRERSTRSTAELAVEINRKRQNSEEDLVWRPLMGYADGKQPTDEE